MKFMQLLRILRAHTVLICLTLLGAWVLAIAATVFMTPKYVATSSVLIDAGDNLISNNPATSPPQTYSNHLATQIDLITGQTVALKVVDRLKLSTDARARARYLGSDSSFEDALRGIKNWVQSALNSLVASSPEADDDAHDASAEAAHNRLRLADRVQKKTLVRTSPDSNVIQVSYSAASARAAADAANAIVDAYIEAALELNVRPARASSQWLDAQVGRLTDNLQRARAELSDFQQRTGIIGDAGDDDDAVARLTDLNSQLVAAQSQNHPAILALKGDVARAQAKLNELPPQLGPNHPSYRSAQNEARALQARLEEESARIADNLRREIAAQKNSMLQMKRQHAQMAALKDNVESAQRELDLATQRAGQAQMNSQVTQTNISVVGVAVPPKRPTTPNPMFNLAFATIVGLALGVGVAIWREVVCRFVRSADDIRDFLGVQVLGVLHDGPRSFSRRARIANSELSARHLISRAPPKGVQPMLNTSG